VQTIERFKKGDFNVLVATSVGEEGLDIGEVDVIYCYDVGKSSIKMVRCDQRTGLQTHAAISFSALAERVGRRRARCSCS
jgi:ERCC4-related helicase